MAKRDIAFIRPSYTPLKQLFERFSKSDITINEIWDVGAFKGEWTKEVMAYAPRANFTLFEPNVTHNAILSGMNVKIFNFLLGNIDSSVEFYSHGGSGDSIFPEFNELSQVRSSFRIQECHKIETLLAREPELRTPDFLKLDVQGAELEILKGAGTMLSSIKIILLECPIVNYNWGSPNIHDYLEFMYQHNFVPYFITEVHRLNEIVAQIDIAFVGSDVFDSKIMPLSASGFWASTMKKYSV